MNIFETYGSDKVKSEKGVWVSLETKELATPEQQKTEACVLLARSGASNKRYTTEYNRRLLKLRKGYRSTDKIPYEMQEQVVVETVAKTILLDWVNHRDRNGKAIPYTEKNAIELLRQLPDYRIDIEELASSIDFFQEDVKDDIKNLKAS